MSKPKVKIAPYEQGKQLYENVSQYNSNLLSIFSNLGGFAKDIVTSPAPCEMSKFFTDQVCRINEKTINLLKGDIKIGFMDFKKIKQLTSNSTNIVKKLIKNPNTATKNNINQLEDNINQIEQINERNTKNLKVLDKLRKAGEDAAKLSKAKTLPKQKSASLKGGGNSSYNYIVNPRTNRKVNIDSRIGKKVLKNYISNMQ